MKKYAGILALALIMMAGIPSRAIGAQSDGGRLNIVATTVFFEDLVKRIGGERVEVRHVASPKFNIHFIQPKPSDVRNVSKADLFVFGGLDLEAWADPLLEASGNRKLFRGAEGNVDLSCGIALLNAPTGTLSRSAGDQHAFGNPHYVMDPENLAVMAATVLEKLKEADPAGASVYQANADRFSAELGQKLAAWRLLADRVRGKEVISYHEDFAYLARFAGLKSEVFLEPKPGIPPTPQQIKYLEEYIPGHHVGAIVAPTYFPHEAIARLSERTGVPSVTIAQNAGEVDGTGDVLSFFDHNLNALADGLK